MAKQIWRGMSTMFPSMSGNGLTGGKKKGNKRPGSARPNVDIPVMRVGGLCFKAVDKHIKQIRKKKLNTLDKGVIVSETYLDVVKIPSIKEGEESAVNVAVLGHVNAKKGCTTYLKACQDEAIVKKHIINDKEVTLLGVFDGHGKGGEKVSKSCVALLGDALENKKSTLTSTGETIKIHGLEVSPPSIEGLLKDQKEYFTEIFEYLHNLVCSSNDFSAKECGTTATIGTIIDKIVTLNWVGDSQAALFISYSDEMIDFIPYFVTSKHNFQTEEERLRVKKYGGRLGHANNVFGKFDPFSTSPVRIFGNRGNGKPGLMISKSIGDSDAHKLGLSYEPSSLTLDFNKIENIGDLQDLLPEDYNLSMQQLVIKRTRNHRANKKRNKGKLNRPNSTGSMLSSVRKGVESFSTTLSKKTSKQNITETEEPVKKIGKVDFSDASFGDMNTSSEFFNRNQKIKHCVMIIGSDGLWDQLSKEEVSKILPKLLAEGGNVSLEIGLKAIEKYRKSFDEPTTEAKCDDISIVANVLF